MKTNKEEIVVYVAATDSFSLALPLTSWIRVNFPVNECPKPLAMCRAGQGSHLTSHYD